MRYQVVVTGRRSYKDAPDLCHQISISKFDAEMSFAQREYIADAAQEIGRRLDRAEAEHRIENTPKTKPRLFEPEDPFVFRKAQEEHRKIQAMLKAEREAKEADLSLEREALESNPLYGMF